MQTTEFFRRREQSAFEYQQSPVRRSTFLEGAMSLDAFECGLATLPVPGMERYTGRLVEYALPAKLGRLVISAGILGEGLLGVALDYWGECEREWEQLVHCVQNIVLPGAVNARTSR